MAKTILNISKKHREFIDKCKKNNILFNTLENKDIFFIAVAMGMDSPQELDKKEDFIRSEYIYSSDKALLISLLIGNNETIDEINMEKCYLEAEKCAEAGFKKLSELVENSNWDKHIIEKELLAQEKELSAQINTQKFIKSL